MKILELIEVHTYYEESHILNGISLQVEESSVVSLLGRNGMGKTTTIHSIVGFTPPRQGEIFFKGEEISRLLPYQICQAGLALVPQGRRIFPSLSVEENLIIAARNVKKGAGWSLERAYFTFPVLKAHAKRKGNRLSGGEQQMVAIARALLTNPELLIMDEPSEGLAPLIVRDVGRIILQLRNESISIFLVEQNLHMALRISNFVYILSNGEIVYHSTPLELANDKEIQGKYLAVESGSANGR
jgi:branched-chain amino acid transport system ATP-binding protein